MDMNGIQDQLDLLNGNFHIFQHFCMEYEGIAEAREQLFRAEGQSSQNLLKRWKTLDHLEVVPGLISAPLSPSQSSTNTSLPIPLIASSQSPPPPVDVEMSEEPSELSPPPVEVKMDKEQAESQWIWKGNSISQSALSSISQEQRQALLAGNGVTPPGTPARNITPRLKTPPRQTLDELIKEAKEPKMSAPQKKRKTPRKKGKKKISAKTIPTPV